MSNDIDKDMALDKGIFSVDLMFPGTYLKKEDLLNKAGEYVEPVVTIKKVTSRMVRMKDQTKEQKFCVHLEGKEKVWIIAKTVAGQIAAVTREPNPHKWAGKRIKIWADLAVEAFGRVVGGIRVKAAPAEEKLNV